MRGEGRPTSSPHPMHAWRASDQGVKQLASRQALNTKHPGSPGDLGEQMGVPCLLGTAGWLLMWYSGCVAWACVAIPLPSSESAQKSWTNRGNKMHAFLWVRFQLAFNHRILSSVENMTEIAWISNLPVVVKNPTKHNQNTTAASPKIFK